MICSFYIIKFELESFSNSKKNNNIQKNKVPLISQKPYLPLILLYGYGAGVTNPVIAAMFVSGFIVLRWFLSLWIYNVSFILYGRRSKPMVSIIGIYSSWIVAKYLSVCWKIWSYWQGKFQLVFTFTYCKNLVFFFNIIFTALGINVVSPLWITFIFPQSVCQLNFVLFFASLYSKFEGFWCIRATVCVWNYCTALVVGGYFLEGKVRSSHTIQGQV